MFAGLMKRWRSGSSRAAERPNEQASRPPPAPAHLAPPVQPWRLVRRRPLIGSSGAIAGWDLQLPAATAERIARPGSPHSVRDAHQSALIHAARCVAQSERVALLAVPAPMVLDTTFLAALPPQTILRLGAEHKATFGSHCTHVVDRLIQRRLRVALAENISGAIDLLDGTQYSDRTSLLAAANSSSPLRSARIAINLMSFEDLSAVLACGFTYCCGAYQRPAQGPQKSQLSAPTASAAAALAAAVAGKPMRELVTLFKSDPTLSFRLLRTVNSAAFGLSRPAESIQDALTLLGISELYRWLTLMLVSSDAERPLAPALFETALARARLCELLAAERGTEPPEALFVTGAFSLLDVLLDVPLEVPLACARLSDIAVEALIGARGPWRPYLEAALAAEYADFDRIDRAAAQIGLAPDRIAQLSEDAAAWAQQAASIIAQPRQPQRAAGAPA
jgi:hypothetical protein